MRSSVAIVVVVAGSVVVVAAAVELVGGTVAATVVEEASVVTTEAEVGGAALSPPLQDAPNTAERTPIAINRFIVGTHRNHCERPAQIAVRRSTLSSAWSSPSEMRGQPRDAELLHHPAYQ
jgi:hypothetical protein